MSLLLPYLKTFQQGKYILPTKTTTPPTSFSNSLHRYSIDKRMGWDSNPRGDCSPIGFRDRRLRPLGHPSHPQNLLFLPIMTSHIDNLTGIVIVLVIIYYYAQLPQ